MGVVMAWQAHLARSHGIAGPNESTSLLRGALLW
jgi:hypothetical protein